MLEKTQEHDYCMVQLKLQIASKAGTSGLLLADFYDTPLNPSQSGISRLFNTGDCSQSTCSFSTEPMSPARDTRLEVSLSEDLVT